MAIISTLFSAFCLVMLFTESFARVCHDEYDRYDCVWEEWSHWSSCSNGAMQRRRWKVPLDKTMHCRCPDSSDIQTRSCNIDVRRPVDGRWSSWGVWSTCTKSCETGTQVRSRSCTEPPPQNGGKTCPESAREQRVCNTHSCPVQCGGDLTGNGEIKSPRFPLNYPDEVNCEWKIGVEEGLRIKLTFSDFEVETGTGCEYDSLEVYNGKTQDPSKRVAKLCGSDLPVSIESSGKELLLRFHSDSSVNHKGFKLQFVTIVQCGGDLTGNGEIKSPRFPLNYPNEVNCEWKIGVEEGSRIRLTFSDFEVEIEETECGYDSLEVYNGKTQDPSKRVAKLCGSVLPDSIESSGKELLLRFHSDSSINFKGFKLQFVTIVDGSWSSWSVWSTCTKTCQTGTQVRSRSCTQPRPRHGGKQCLGVARGQRVCNTYSCPVDGGWSSWNVWSTCTKTCQTGTQVRLRSCAQPRPRHGGKQCPGVAREQRVCNTYACPVDGGWSSWSVWSTCTKTCQTGTQVRSRSCTQPRPRHGGKQCLGVEREQRVCNTHPCPIPGGWSSWSLLTPCSVTCGDGIEVFTRTCTNPKPQHGGKSCQGSAKEERVCSKKSCPVDGGWSVWNSWSPCAKTCGGGVRERTRSCTNPPPFFGGKGCGTHYYESKKCSVKICPIDGGWTSWSGWSSCSKSCGTGSLERSRSCTQPAPSSGGKPCPGTARESSWCNSHACPVHGGWSGWSTWSPCDKTCGGGLSERTRSCTNPPPYFGGKGCGPHHYESKECAVNECPVDGGWSAWSNWTECSVTCGTGVTSRERQCDSPAPVAGGRSCLGHHRDVKPCNTTKICIDRVGCFGNFSSTLLKDFRNDIKWFGSGLPFSKQMEKMVEKCAHVAKTKGLRFFAVENYGKCYGTRDYSPGTQLKATRCRFGVGLENHYYVYEISP